MTFYEHASHKSPMPGSPPDLSGSKSSKSSSFHSSYQSDDNSMLSDVGHFEDIGLDDESRAEVDIGHFEFKKTTSKPYDASYTSDIRAAAKQRKRAPIAHVHGNRPRRELTSGRTRPSFPSLQGQVQSATDGLGLLPVHNGTNIRKGLSSTIDQSLPMARRNRSVSPNIPRSPSPSTTFNPSRRSSWQTNKERKSVIELERECDEEDGDDVPDECCLENVPMSPRPPSERTKSTPPSTSTSPERRPKEKVRSVGNGTSPRPAEQGELRSPRGGMARNTSMGQFPINHDQFSTGRAKSWTVASSDLSPETRALTEALEAHAEEEEQKELDPRMRRSFTNVRPIGSKPRIQSAIAELPPLRRTDIMIDPLPISKEKEAVLSRTRPSWLPPKNPAEEKKHLKEYKKMMATAMEAEKRREADSRAKTKCRDDTASSLLRIWEEHVLPNWDETTRQKRTRELWWRGIAPRSRSAVWTKAIGNELGLSDSSYTAALRRAQALEKTIKSGSQLSNEEQKKKAWLDRITRDAESTYPELKICQPDGPLHGSLVDVLKAYAMYRSDVGYVPGTSTMAALLLLNLPSPAASFCALSNILNRPLALSFHTSDSGATTRAYALLFSTLQTRSPHLHKHLTSMDLPPDRYLREIFTSLMTSCLSLDNATRLWDVMVFEGDAVVVRAGVAWLVNMEGRLLSANSPQAVIDVVKRGLDNLEEEKWMASVRMAGRH